MTENQGGFTLLEVLVAVAIIGVLAGIIAPKYISFLERARLTSASDKIYLAIKEAQSEAQSHRSPWRLSIREHHGSIEWATHSNAVSYSEAQWKLLEIHSLQIDEETTFASAGGVYYIRFDEHGNPHRLGRITISGESLSNQKRCIVVSTLIGAMRKAKEQPLPDPSYRTRDRFCY